MLFSNKVILGFHKIGKDGIDIFEGQIKNLLLRYKIVPLSQLLSTSGMAASLTFDDGYRDFYTNAFPMLKRYNIRATIFIITDAIDKEAPLARLYPQGFAPAGAHDESDWHLNKTQLEELSDYGIELGGHSHMHRKLTELPEPELTDDLAKSSAIIKDVTGQLPTSFCYPQGFFDARIWPLLEKAGYKYAVCSYNSRGVTADTRKLLSFKNPYALPRIYPSKGEFRLMLQLSIIAPWLYRNSII